MTYAHHPYTPNPYIQKVQKVSVRIDAHRPLKCQGAIKKGLLYLLYIWIGVWVCLAGVPTSSAVTAFDCPSCTSPVRIKGTPGGYQVEGEFGVASSLVWLDS